MVWAADTATQVLGYVWPIFYLLLLAAAVVALEGAEVALMALPDARVASLLPHSSGMVARGLEALQRAPQAQRLALACLKAMVWLLVVLHGLTTLGLADLLSDDEGLRRLGPHLGLLLGVCCAAFALQLVGMHLGRCYPLVLGPWVLALSGPLATVLGGLGHMLKPLQQWVGWPKSHKPQGAGSLAALPSGPWWTPDAIAAIRDRAHQERLGDRGHELLASIAAFSDTVIREIMVPRTAVVSIARTMERQAVCEQVLAAGHSRLPVYDDTIDHIIGILHVKDLFAAELNQKPTDGPFDVLTLVRPVFYVPEVMHISALLREFQRRKTHMAIVVDEYGGTSGVVTLEDIIEEIVGEIQDEYDVEEKQFRRLPDGKIIADARVSLWDLEAPLAVKFPDDGDYETLAGFLMTELGHLPQRGAVLVWESLKFTIKEANERRVGMVEIETLPPRDGP